MKQAILNQKKKLLLVELLEDATDVHINDLVYKNKVSFRTNTSLHFIETKENLLGEAPKLIGKLTDITEEQFKEWVEQYMVDKWRNYLTEIQYVEYLKSTAKESFFSYLEANGIYFENPIEKPIMEEYGYCEERDAEGHLYKSYWEPQEGEEEWQEAINEWWEAEQKVWSKDRCYLFEII